MASTNQSPFYQRAEQDFLLATTDEERIACLEIMIKECPKHKSAENMLRNLKTRLKKLKQNLAKQKKSAGSKKGVKKADMQTILTGFTNTGKSTLFEILTEQKTKISPHEFTTHQPQLGTMKYEDVKIQLIDLPAFPAHDKSLVNATDTILLVVDNINQITEAEPFIKNSPATKLILFNKTDLLNPQEKRKLSATLKSKKINPILFSQKSNKNEIEQLKQKISNTFIPKKVIRIYTKEPKKPASKEPMILKSNSTIQDAAEKILKGMSKKISRCKIWGPSSKFAGQVVGLEHQLKDKDIIELQT